jgi:hypothetical protein
MMTAIIALNRSGASTSIGLGESARLARRFRRPHRNPQQHFLSWCFAANRGFATKRVFLIPSHSRGCESQVAAATAPQQFAIG